jgi:hypothetical protein
MGEHHAGAGVMMRVLDLFSGMGGWSAAFKERGHTVVTVDIDYRFNPTYVRNIGELATLNDLGTDFDVILASPPCQAFSLAASNKQHWKWKDGIYHPQTPQAKHALALAAHTFALIEAANPRYYIIENPRGFMSLVIRPETTIVDLCQYGLAYKKPTCLWGGLPPSFVPKRCKGNCDHVKFNKAAKANGYMHDDYWGYHSSRMAAKRAMIPHDLSLAVCVAVEGDLNAHP